MFGQIAGIVVDFVGGFFVVLFLLRFYFQWLRVPFRNPFGEFVLATTSWAVMPARRVLPSLAGLDTASFACAWLAQALLLALIYALAGRDFGAAPGALAGTLFAVALVDLLQTTVKMLLFAVVVQALLSWVSPHAPVQYVLDSLTRPLLRPIRRLLPPVANVDLSPLVLILALTVLLVPVAELRKLAAGLF